MSLKPGDNIPKEVHKDTEQFFRIESGEGIIILNGTQFSIKDGDVVIVKMGVEHYVENTSKDKDLKLYTIYSPPHHKHGLVQKSNK